MLTSVPVSSAAQSTVRDIVTFLVTNQNVPTANPDRDRAAADAASVLISRALLVNLASVPLATSSGGFVYRFNPRIGTAERATRSFGAFFVDRALTAGRDHASLGVAFSESSFDRLDGHRLTDGTLVTTANQFRDEASPYDVESLTLDIQSSTMTLVGAVGVADGLELGAAVPFVHLTLDGQRINLYRGTTFVQASGAASASGVGDVAIRAKQTLLSGDRLGIAALGEVRLPTGDERNLLGAGSPSYHAAGVVSFDTGTVAIHGNAGFVRGGISDEIQALAAASVAVHPRVTLSGEAVVRRVSALHAIALGSAPHPAIAGVDTLRLVAGESSTILASAIAGLKWNVAGRLVIGGHIGLPLARHGLTATLTPAVALEYGF
jgi:hypothetical protein